MLIVLLGLQKVDGSFFDGSSAIVWPPPIAPTDSPASLAARETACMPEAACLSDLPPPPPPPPPFFSSPPIFGMSSIGFVSVNDTRKVAEVAKGLVTVTGIIVGM